MFDSLMRITPEELSVALAYVLAAPPDYRIATRSAIHIFLSSAEHSSNGWVGYRVGAPSEPRGLVLGLQLKGRTVLMLPAPVGQNGLRAEETAAAFQACLTALEPTDFTFAQTILPLDQRALHEIIESAGFTRLTELIYLERDARYPWLDAPAAETAWLEYSSQSHAQFCDCILRTYEGTQDCPELIGMRTIEDTIASHMGAGPFDPALWNLLLHDGVPAGVLLCANHTRTFEIVYTGLLPEYRGLGLGKILMRCAVAHARRRGVNHLTVAVDERNLAAIRLYEQHHFEPISRRIVHLMRSRASRTEQAVRGS